MKSVSYHIIPFTYAIETLLVLLLLSPAINITASDKPISGTVIDAKTKTPLPFTNIMIAGQYKGTVSNADGLFVLDDTNLVATDIIIFSYMGYKTLEIEVGKLQNKKRIQLHPASINLEEVSVLSRQLSAKEILALVKENYDKNYPAPTNKNRMFYHKLEKVPFPDENQIHVKRSDFAGLDKKTMNEFIAMMPEEFIDYQDAIVDLYRYEGNDRLVPVEGISLVEGSYDQIQKEFEDKLLVLFEDFKESRNDSNVYYKFRSGVFAKKIETNEVNDSLWLEHEKDPDNYTVETSEVKSGIISLINNYADIESKNWEFINDPGKYKYELKPITVYNNELLYQISFVPRNRGLFKGTMFISMSSYAILQLDFAFAQGKQNEKFQLLGIGHAMNFKKARVLFEKGKSGYYLKYITAEQDEFASVDRDFSVKKKEKRFLTDKELSEIKIELNLIFNINSSWELLVLDSKEITQQQFDKVNQPSVIKFRKEYAYTPEMWNNRTVLVPTAELMEYKRK